MIALITKKNWIYWLLLALAFVLLMLFYKSKMRSEKIDKQLEQGISRESSIANREWFSLFKGTINLLDPAYSRLTIDDSRNQKS